MLGNLQKRLFWRFARQGISNWSITFFFSVFFQVTQQLDAGSPTVYLPAKQLKKAAGKKSGPASFSHDFKHNIIERSVKSLFLIKHLKSALKGTFKNGY